MHSHGGIARMLGTRDRHQCTLSCLKHILYNIGAKSKESPPTSVKSGPAVRLQRVTHCG